MSHNIYIYILVMAAVTYLIRMLPLALSRKEIQVHLSDHFCTMFPMHVWQP